MKGPSVLNRTQQSAFWLRVLSGWPANSCWATVPTVLRDPIPAPATWESVWLLDAPDYLNGPQSAGEMGMVGVTGGWKWDGNGTGGLCLVGQLNGLGKEVVWEGGVSRADCILDTGDGVLG